MYEYRKLTDEECIRLVEERLARGFPPHSPPHFTSEPGHYLLTAACYEHKHHMTTQTRRRQILQALLDQFAAHEIEVNAWVVLPNHYHVLLYSSGNSHLGRILRPVHGRTAHMWNKEDGAPGRKVWYSYSDRSMRNERHYYTTLNYIHYNPVKHDHVNSPYAWEESSVHWYRESFGRQWLRDMWHEYPIRDYGKVWDSM